MTSTNSPKPSASFLAGKKRGSWVGSFEVSFGPVTWCCCQEAISAVEIIPLDLAVTEKKLSFLLCFSKAAWISWVGAFVWKENGESQLPVWVWHALHIHSLTSTSVMKCAVEHVGKNLLHWVNDTPVDWFLCSRFFLEHLSHFWKAVRG